MSRIIVVALLILSTLLFFGCAPAEEPAEDAAAPAPVEAPAPGAVVGEDANALSPQPQQVFEPFPTDETLVPEAILDRLETQQPMLLFFHDPAQRVTDDQRQQIEAVIDDYRGVIDLVSFDIGKYVKTDDSGRIELRPGITEDPSADKVARLLSSDNLNVTFTPYLIFIDGQGHITHRFRGFVDEKIIEREIMRATE